MNLKPSPWHYGLPFPPLKSPPHPSITTNSVSCVSCSALKPSHHPSITSNLMLCPSFPPPPPIQYIMFLFRTCSWCQLLRILAISIHLLLQTKRFQSNWRQNNDKILHHIEFYLMPVAWKSCNFNAYVIAKQQISK